MTRFSVYGVPDCNLYFVDSRLSLLREAHRIVDMKLQIALGLVLRERPLGAILSVKKKGVTGKYVHISAGNFLNLWLDIRIRCF